MKRDDKKWHWLEVSNGRFLCEEHGGYCCESDGHSTSCPLCKSTVITRCTINYVHRCLRSMNGLQERSQRLISVSLSFLSAGAAITLFRDALTSHQESVATVYEIPEPQLFALIGAAVCILVAVALLSFSMRQVTVIERNRFLSKTASQWEEFLAAELAKMEAFHSMGIYCFALSLACLIAFGVEFAITNNQGTTP